MKSKVSLLAERRYWRSLPDRRLLNPPPACLRAISSAGTRQKIRSEIGLPAFPIYRAQISQVLHLAPLVVLQRLGAVRYQADRCRQAQV